eukprot:TRINITY_DN389_c0_g1_i7.p1 TRINITY_DN389_c0_g1~~TRINITY_DN389_c0_g1_i7.p1  ORF type:complete len:122 (-),score=16.63 TRINITY_DN389_c0_g1_i7:121-486(-)
MRQLYKRQSFSGPSPLVLTLASRASSVYPLVGCVCGCLTDVGGRLYTSGVYCPTGCSSTSLDHGVGVVGMNTDPVKGDYYIVRNSWGTSWGMQGYLEMCANHNNNCGIATSATYTTGCHKP